MIVEIITVYDPEHRHETPHAPAPWQLTDEGLAAHVRAIRVRRHLMHSVRKHGQHQGEPYLKLAAAQLVTIARLEALRVVDDPPAFCAAAARRIVDAWAAEGKAQRAMEYAAMRSGVAA